MCNNWPDFPIEMNQYETSTGGLIGNTAIICGGREASGYNSVDECYSLTSEKAILVTHMSIGRYDAASIVLNDKTLWVTGGYNKNHGGNLASTEYVTLTGTMFGPDLPMTLKGHAMVAINSTSSIVIGGYADGQYGDITTSTLFYDHNEGEWITGPSLMQARAYHAAGIITDEVTDEPFVAVTGGFYYNSSVFHNSIAPPEIF